MKILGIESSCDDTSVALLDCSKSGCFIVSEKIASQIEIHKKYGGVVPEIAGRLHAEKITPLIEEVLKNRPRPDAIAVASGPGLVTGLIVGVEAARTLSYAWKIPLVSVNHIEGHICSVEIPNSHRTKRDPASGGGKFQILKPKNKNTRRHSDINTKIVYPAIALIASGGHTELILIKKIGEYKLLGATKDDAAGECFDKVAQLLKLPYPGGPQISKLAEKGDAQAINFPRPMLNQNNFDFSFSGLKTAALYWLRDHSSKTGNCELGTVNCFDFSASFEQAIIDVLVGKTLKAIEQYKPKTVILAGGVAANKKLRRELAFSIAQIVNCELRIPELKYCMDNAAMIAVAGYYKAIKKNYADWRKLQADPNWELGRHR